MRRVVIRGILLLIVIAWLAGAGVMLFFDPQAPQHVPFEALILGGDAARVLGYGDIFMASMPQAPTFLGRVHDTIGHWPLFSWIPSLK